MKQGPPVADAAGVTPVEAVALAPATRFLGVLLLSGAAQAYQLLAGLGLAVILVGELQRGGGLFSILLTLVGLIMLLFPFRWGPLGLLLLYGAGQWSARMAWTRFGPDVFSGAAFEHVLVCTGFLCYTVSHYRLQGILLHLLPLDPRQRAGPSYWSLWHLRRVTPVVEEKRAVVHVTPIEITWLVLTIPFWALAAQLTQHVLSRPWDPVNLERFAGIFLLAWMLGVGMFVTATVLRYWSHCQRSPQEARLFLQDALWRETRGEQRRLHRWLAWARLSRR